MNYKKVYNEQQKTRISIDVAEFVIKDTQMTLGTLRLRVTLYLRISGASKGGNLGSKEWSYT